MRTSVARWLILDGGGAIGLCRPMLRLQPGVAGSRRLRRRTLPARGVSPSRLGTQDSGILGKKPRAPPESARCIWRWVRENTAALELYRKLGFVEHPSTFLSKWIAHDFAKPPGRHGH